MEEEQQTSQEPDKSDKELESELNELGDVEEFIQKNGAKMLEYEKQMFLDALHSDALIVCAKGVSFERVFLNLLKVYCDPASLILVVNSTDYEEKLYKKLLNTHLVYESSTNANERERVYYQGGIQFISTRVLVVDLLKKRIPVELITGIFVLRAHAVIESCQEAFALRLFRQGNKIGFVKAFSNYVEAFTIGYGHVEKVMRNLFITELLIWPRFHATIQRSLKPFEPQIVELHIPMTHSMTMIQTCLLDLMNFLVKEIKRLNRFADLEEVTVENCVTKQFNRILQAQLDHIWYRLSAHTKLLISDLKILRNLLFSTIYNDSVALYALVNQYRTTEYVRNNSGWVLLDAADSMFTLVKKRVFNKDGEFEPEHCAKWKALSEVLRVEIPNDIKETIKRLQKSKKPVRKDPVSVLILCSDARTCHQINQYLTEGPERYLFFNALRNNIQVGKLSESYRKLEKPRQSVQVLRPGPSSSETPVPKKNPRKSTAEAPNEEKSEVEEFLTKDDALPDAEEVHYRESYILTMSQKSGADVTLDETFSVKQGDLLFESYMETKDDFDLSAVTASLTKPVVVIQTFRNCEASQYGPGSTVDKTLESLNPGYIVMYNTNVAAIRHIEAFEARQQREPESRLKVFFLIHAKTVEEQGYLTLLRREKQAFELLIETKQHMVIPKYQDGRCDDVLAAIQQEIFEEAASASTRKAGGQQLVPPSQQKRRVVVDMREFRSDLPCLIHKRGIEVVPVTIAIGDYILTPEICVERKSISDLIQSLNSGRLYQQCVQMCRYYSKPILLIEFDQNKPFHLQRNFMISGEPSSNADITQKLQLLTIHFPKLKLVWSPSPYATSQLFEELKLNKAEPDPETAAALGSEEALNDLDVITKKYNANIHDFIIKLPGINSKNIARVLREGGSLKKMIKMTEAQLSELLGNTADAKMLHKSFHVAFKPTAAATASDFKPQPKFKPGFSRKFK